MIPDAGAFLDAIKSSSEESAQVARLATVTSVSSGRARVLFDGEPTGSNTAYAYATGTTFTTGNRVLLIPVGNTYVIVCRVTP